jgi:hypothetical protein
VQVETGTPHFSKLLSNGSTRIISLFTICLLVHLVVSVDVHEDVVLAEVSLEPTKNSAGDGKRVCLAVGDESLV